MSSRGWNIVGIIALLAALLFGVSGVSAGSSLDSVLSRHGDHQSDGSYTCDGDPTQVAIDIAADKKPQAQATDPDTGTHYLRYGRDVVSVAAAGSTDCLVKIEPRNRVGGGAFIFLGPGFYPSAPARSPGGTSGGAGVK